MRGAAWVTLADASKPSSPQLSRRSPARRRLAGMAPRSVCRLLPSRDASRVRGLQECLPRARPPVISQTVPRMRVQLKRATVTPLGVRVYEASPLAPIWTGLALLALLLLIAAVFFSVLGQPLGQRPLEFELVSLVILAYAPTATAYELCGRRGAICARWARSSTSTRWPWSARSTGCSSSTAAGIARAGSRASRSACSSRRCQPRGAGSFRRCGIRSSAG